jgi:DNA replication protein DnaC
MFLLEIIEDRHGRRSNIISSQLHVTKWYKVIGEITIADAILDGMVHIEHRIELKGDFLRRNQKATYFIQQFFKLITENNTP